MAKKLSETRVPLLGWIVRLEWSADWKGRNPWKIHGKILRYFDAHQETRNGVTGQVVVLGPLGIMIAR